MRLERIVDVTGSIVCITGLRIGGTRDTVGIGEIDNPIIHHPISRLPYVPGSSLKGKLRSLLEVRYSAESQQSGNPCGCGTCVICRLFGCGKPRNIKEPTRLIVRDAFLTDESRELLQQELAGSFVEVKTELKMDRKTGAASDGGNRQVLRVPEGTIFSLNLSVRLFAEDSADSRTEYLTYLSEGFDLLEKDYLGGNGTRGYGQVSILHDDKRFSEYLRSLTW